MNILRLTLFMIISPLMISSASGEVVMAINAGGSSFVGSDGVSYSADKNFSSGTAKDYGSVSIASTSDDRLYQTERYGDVEYSFSLPNGKYEVILKFAEMWKKCFKKDCRIFDLEIEGKKVVSNLDVYASAGGERKALDKKVKVELKDGKLNLKLVSIKQNPKISAIVIRKVVEAPVNTAPVVGALTDISVEAGTALPLIPFTVSDKESAASSLNVTALSSNQNLVKSSGLVLGGSGNNRTLQVIPVAGSVGTSTITVKVSDGSLSSSASFVLEINPPPVVAGSGLIKVGPNSIVSCPETNCEAMVDEQALAGDPLNGAGGKPLTQWNPYWSGTFPKSSVIDLGGEYELDHVYLYDSNGIQTINVYGGLDKNKVDDLLFTDPLSSYLTWKGHKLNSVRTRYIRVEHFKPISFREILFYGKVAGGQQPPVTDPDPEPEPPVPGDTTLKAFPSAQGFGKVAKGGRGGRVIFVTNLNDSGSGSLREALEASGPRIVVFRVGGTIHLKSQILISKPYLTVAGQTAPGDGILIRGGSVKIKTSEVIIRNLRFRIGKAVKDDAITIASNGSMLKNIILDHCSVSWSSDENIGINGRNGGLENVTVQNSIIAEGLKNHSMGLLVNKQIDGVGPDRVSVHKNLFVSNQERNPMIGYGISATVINNIVHNWKTKGSEYHRGTSGDVLYNKFKLGRDTKASHRAIEISDVGGPESTIVHIKGNDLPGGQDSYNGDGSHLSSSPHFTVEDYGFVPMTVMDQIEAHVLANAGAFPRDAVDLRIINEYKNGTGKTIYDEAETPGYPNIKGGNAPADSDNDGMPDAWEIQNGLNPNVADGHIDSDGDGYTNLEEYLNSYFQ